MDKTILIHNPRCSKSREAKEILENAGVDFITLDYVKEGFKEKLLSLLPELLGLPYSEMIREKESIYKELKLGEKNISNQEWIKVLTDHPILIERPIFIHKHQAVIARPPDLVKTIL